MNCGCKIQNGPYNERADAASIIFCALHASFGELLTQLKLLHSHIHKDKMVKCGGKKCSTAQIIARAESKEAK